MRVQDITVSACRGAFDRNAYQVNLVQWLEDCRPTSHEAARNKKALPAIMPHGYFLSRKADSIVGHSGLVQIDIDAKHQSGDWSTADTIEAISALPCVVCVGVSCSGNGVWALVAVAGIDQNNHKEMADHVCSIIEEVTGDQLDRPVTTNLASLRFASPYVPFINYDVTPLL